mgnify:CR=1 FL=1
MDKLQKYISAFSNPKIEKLGLIANILSDLSYDELHKLKVRIPKMFSSIIEVKYLKRTSFEKVASSGYLIDKKGNIVEYLGVLAYIFEQHQNDLNLFVQLQSEFEICLFKGDYDRCYAILDEINNQISYSYWAADIKIKLDRLVKGVSEASGTYNELHKQNKKLHQLCYWSFKTSATDVPFNSDVERFLQKFSDDFYRGFIVSHCFQYFDLIEGNWMYTSSTFSIIDLYCTFIFSLEFLSKTTFQNSMFKHYISIINRTINDSRVQKLCFLLNISRDACLNSAERDGIIKKYYCEKLYDEVIQESENYLVQYPTDIAVMDVFVKSCIIQHKNIAELHENSPMYKRIIHSYYQYFLNNSESCVYKQKLINLCNVWVMFPSIKHLLLIIKDREENNLSRLSNNYWRKSYGLNFQDIAFYEEKKDKESFLSSWNLELYHLFKNNEHKLETIDFFDLQLSDRQISFQEVKTLDSLIEKKSFQPFYRDAMCSYVFNQYLSNNKINEAVSFFVREILDKEPLNLTLFSENNEVVENLVGTDIDKSFDNPLDFSIFYTYLNTEPYKRYLSYKRYLKQISMDKPSGLIIDGSDKQRFFLENVADRKVLALHSRMFKDSNEVIEERILICKNLYEFYKEKQYLEEISSLNKEQQVNGFVRQVDYSKIYVDIESIKNKELKDKEFNSIFDLFKSTDENLKFLEDNPTGLKNILSILQNAGLSLTIYTGDKSVEVDYKYSLFKKLCLDIRDRFVLDPKYGLDYYLSTRIRHGTIDNQLRNHLQEYHLVTNADESGAYLPNSYWIQRLNASNDNLIYCTNIFSEFSKQIDEIIYTLKSEFIQIKTETNTQKGKAVFDFSDEKIESYIRCIYLECFHVNFDEFVSLVFNKLWEYTEMCMEQMREVLAETHAKMRNLLEQLSSNISNEMNTNSTTLKSLKDTITSCQTQLQTDFNTVQGWFHRENTFAFDFTISQVIDASLLAINRINQDSLHVKRVIKSPSSFRGDCFGSFHDLFHDLFNNVLDYEKKRNNKKGQSQVFVEEKQSILHIKVINPIDINDAPELEKLIEETSNYSAQINKGRSRSEGKSGFAKIYNIVQNVFESDDNTYKNLVANEKFTADITINISKLIRNENTNC